MHKALLHGPGQDEATERHLRFLEKGNNQARHDESKARIEDARERKRRLAKVLPAGIHMMKPEYVLDSIADEQKVRREILRARK